MKVMTHEIPFKRGETIKTIMAGSCFHIGNPAVHIEGIQKFFDKAKTTPYILHGDMIEGILPKDRRYEPEEHQMMILDAINRVADLIRPTAKMCIGSLQGNHESTPSRDIGDIAEYIAIQARVPYLEEIAVIEFECPDGSFTGWFAHGNGSANYRTGEPERKEASKVVKLRQLLKDFDADICGMGHLHKSITTTPCAEMRLSLRDGEVKRRPCLTRPGWFYACPSMFKTYSEECHHGNYASRSLFPATDMGWIEWDINRKGEIQLLREVDENGDTLTEKSMKIVR